MENSLLGKLIQEKNDIWRIFQITSVVAKGCLVERDGKPCTSLQFKEWNTIELYERAVDGDILKLTESEPCIITEDAMVESALEMYRKRISFVAEVLSPLNSNYETVLSKESRQHINKTCKKYGYCSATAWKFIRKYIQSGMRFSSLLDGRLTRTDERSFVGKLSKNPGRKSDDSCGGKVLSQEDLEHIRWGIDLFLKSRTATMEYCYLKMLIRFYINDDGRLKDSYPSKRQFRYQMKLQTTAEMRKKAKSEKYEFENNSRLLYDTPRNDALRPGQILESDECEMDVMVVSSANRRQIIGRPIVYFLMDLYSHVIVGMSVHLHNNSIAGITSAFLNLFENKQDYCQRFGIEFSNPDLWPSCFVPDEIRSDQGSEYGSDQFERICQVLNIRRSLAPPKMGSYKGGVERTFGSMMTLLRPELEDRGLIMKTHDSNHYKTAMYTMHDITRLCINFVIHHNNMVIDKMKLGREMSMNGVRKVPSEIWKWGIEHRGQPTRMITPSNISEIVYGILTPATARLSRNCVMVKGLKYLPSDDAELMSRLVTLGLKKESETMEVRIDPRDTNRIYYLKNCRISQMNLVVDKIGNDGGDMTWDEMEAEQEIIRNHDRKDQVEKLQLRCNELSNVENILSDSAPSEFKPIKKNIRDNRAVEKTLLSEEENLSGKMNSEKTKDSLSRSVSPKDNKADKDKDSVSEKSTEDAGKTSQEPFTNLSNMDAFIAAMEETGRLGL